MIVWLDGAHGVRENMARDEALLRRAEAGLEAVLRLFAFAPPGITLGYRQDPARELDLDACRRDGVEWALRPTGGRAIFHAQEWTYSLSAPLADPRWGGGLVQTCASASSLLVASLRRLGVDARLAPGGRRGHAHRGARSAGHGADPPCFASTARHEIVLDGRKLVGSAQRRTARALLQQGSLLLGPGHARVVDYLWLPAERRAAWRADLLARSAGAGDRLTGARLDDWSAALLAELPSGSLFVQGDEGVNLSTLPGGALYTPVAPHPESRPAR